MITALRAPRLYWRSLATRLPADSQPPVVLTVAETCKALRVSRWTVYQLIRSGRLATVKLGTRRLVPLESVHALLRADCEAA